MTLTQNSKNVSLWHTKNTKFGIIRFIRFRDSMNDYHFFRLVILKLGVMESTFCALCSTDLIRLADTLYPSPWLSCNSLFCALFLFQPSPLRPFSTVFIRISPPCYFPSLIEWHQFSFLFLCKFFELQIAMMLAHITCIENPRAYCLSPGDSETTMLWCILKYMCLSICMKEV